MTTLNDLIQSVYTITNRPDLVAETQQAVLKATLKEHSTIDYPSDLVISSPITLDNTNGVWRYTLSQVTLGLYPSLRRIKTIREVLATTPDAFDSFQGYYGEIDFEEISSNNIFDSYQMEKYNYYYRQGNSINLVAYRQVNKVVIQYYAQPNITLTGYSSWIADKFPYAIYDAAAADIFQMIGKTDEFGIYRNKIGDNRLDIIKSEISPTG